MNKEELIELLEKQIIHFPSGDCPSCTKGAIIQGLHPEDTYEHYGFYNKAIYDSIEKIKAIKWRENNPLL